MGLLLWPQRAPSCRGRRGRGETRTQGEHQQSTDGSHGLARSGQQVKLTARCEAELVAGVQLEGGRT